MKPEPTKKQRDAKEDSTIAPGLYLIATPIGNLGDITLRALEVLKACDYVVCEDTRQSGKLLKAHDIRKPLGVYNDHVDAKDRDRLIEKILEGQAIALLSDAGMPLISDPGYKLVRSCLEENIYITSLPGANAALSALQLSGLPGGRFTFGGFLPPRPKARQDALKSYAGCNTALIFYETPARLQATLEDILYVLGDRETAVLRELTKLHEERQAGPVSKLVQHYKMYGRPKGELVLVIGPPDQKTAPDTDIEIALEKALEFLNTKQAASLIAGIYGCPKKEAYNLALKLSR